MRCKYCDNICDVIIRIYNRTYSCDTCNISYSYRDNILYNTFYKIDSEKIKGLSLRTNYYTGENIVEIFFEDVLKPYNYYSEEDGKSITLNCEITEVHPKDALSVAQKILKLTPFL